MGVKSSLCLVLKIMFLVLISRMAGGWRGVAMANRASWGGLLPSLSHCWRLWPWRNFSRPWMFNAWEDRIVGAHINKSFLHQFKIIIITDKKLWIIFIPFLCLRFFVFSLYWTLLHEVWFILLINVESNTTSSLSPHEHDNILWFVRSKWLICNIFEYKQVILIELLLLTKFYASISPYGCFVAGLSVT